MCVCAMGFGCLHLLRWTAALRKDAPQTERLGSVVCGFCFASATAAYDIKDACVCVCVGPCRCPATQVPAETEGVEVGAASQPREARISSTDTRPLLANPTYESKTGVGECVCVRDPPLEKNLAYHRALCAPGGREWFGCVCVCV